MQAALMMSPTGRRVMGFCKGAESDKTVTKLGTGLVDLVAIAGLAIAVLCIIFSSATLAIISAGLLAAFSPYMAYQKRQLLELGTFRGLLNDLRHNINDFIGINNDLSNNVTELSNSVEELENVEKELKQLANTDNLDRLVVVLKDLKQVNAEMRHITEADIVQQIISTVLRTDRNLDLMIGPRELDRLIKKLHAKKGFDLNEEKFRELVGTPTFEDPVKIEKILKVIKNLKDPNIPDSENAFVINKDTLKTVSDAA